MEYEGVPIGIGESYAELMRWILLCYRPSRRVKWFRVEVDEAIGYIRGYYGIDIFEKYKIKRLPATGAYGIVDE